LGFWGLPASEAVINPSLEESSLNDPFRLGFFDGAFDPYCEAASEGVLLGSRKVAFTDRRRSLLELASVWRFVVDAPACDSPEGTRSREFDLDMAGVA
jgi:hypothetical protein